MTTPFNILSNRKAIINTDELYGDMGGWGGGGGSCCFCPFLSVRFCPFLENRVPKVQISQIFNPQLGTNNSLNIF